MEKMRPKLKKFYLNNKELIEKSIENCKIVSNGNLDMRVDFHNSYFTFVVESVKGAVVVKSVWDDDDINERITAVESEIQRSIDCNYGLPKPTHKPLFSAEEIFISIASENI